MVRYMEGRRDRAKHALANPRRIVAVASEGQQKRKLVSGEARQTGPRAILEPDDRVGCAQTVLQAMRYPLEQCVANGGAERLIDPLEFIEAQMKHPPLVSLGTPMAQRPLQSIHKRMAIWKAGGEILNSE